MILLKKLLKLNFLSLYQTYHLNNPPIALPNPPPTVLPRPPRTGPTIGTLLASSSPTISPKPFPTYSPLDGYLGGLGVFLGPLGLVGFLGPFFGFLIGPFFGFLLGPFFGFLGAFLVGGFLTEPFLVGGFLAGAFLVAGFLGLGF